MPVFGHPDACRHFGRIRQHARFLVPVLVEPLDARLRTQFGDGPRETPPSVVAFDARRAGAVALQHGGDERFGRFHAERRIKYVRYVNGVVCPCFVADRAQVVLSRVRRIGVVPLFEEFEVPTEPEVLVVDGAFGATELFSRAVKFS